MTNNTVNETERTLVTRVFDAPRALNWKAWTRLFRTISNYRQLNTISMTSTLFTPVLMIAMLVFTAFKANGQQIKPAESGYAPVNGIEVYYEVYGEGKPLVLLHGAFYTIEMNWGQLIPELSKTRKIVAIEFQGHGHSPYSDRKLDIVTLARDVEGVMNYLKIDSADVAGYSMGGSVAYQFAVLSPKRLSRLVIISSTY